jgi:quercetin dioxygenase-like cupin family protein
MRNRRVIVGVDPKGRSTVTSDDKDLARIEQPNGILLQEIWWQEQVPARADDDGVRAGEIGLAPPPGGAVIRVLTVPPTGFAAGGWVPNLHYDDALHVITMASGELGIILEEGEVTLCAGDSVILPGTVHDLRNSKDEPAIFVYTSFQLAR